MFMPATTQLGAAADSVIEVDDIVNAAAAVNAPATCTRA
jgi:hypothetical protein